MTHHIHHDPAVRALVERAKAEAWDEGHDAFCSMKGDVCGIHGNPYRADSLAAQPAPGAATVEECGNRGPRIGEDGTRCRRSKGHDGPHRTAPSDGFGNVEWSTP